MSWKPSNEPTCYDHARVAQLKPIRDAVTGLGLPLRRMRKVLGLLNMIEMQIEDGGDSPEVNAHLLDALRAGIRHQVDKRAARPALHAIAYVEQAEAERRKAARSTNGVLSRLIRGRNNKPSTTDVIHRPAGQERLVFTR